MLNGKVSTPIIYFNSHWKSARDSPGFVLGPKEHQEKGKLHTSAQQSVSLCTNHMQIHFQDQVYTSTKQHFPT